MNKITPHTIEKINTLAKEKRKYINTYKKEPTIEELATILNTNKDKILELESIIKDNNYNIEEIKPFKVEDLSEDEYNELVELINKNKNLLNIREQEILLLTFGLIDNKYWSLEEISKKYNITVMRVRQIIAKGIRKVRSPKYRPKLTDFIEKD